MYILTKKSTFAFLLVFLEITHISLIIFSSHSKEGLQKFYLYGYLLVCFFARGNKFSVDLLVHEKFVLSLAVKFLKVQNEDLYIV